MNGYLESLARWLDDILERKRMDGEILNEYRDHICAHKVIGRLAAEAEAADLVPALTIPEKAAIRRVAAELFDVLKAVMEREDRLRRTLYGGGSEE